MSALGRVSLTRRVVSGLTGNPAFPAPTPSLGALSAAADALQSAVVEAQSSRAQARAATARQENMQAALTKLLVRQAAYVQNASDCEAATILTSGFGVRHRGSPAGSLPAPVGLTVNVNGSAGVMAFKWKRVKGAKTYVLEIAKDGPEMSWEAVLTSGRPRARVASLTSGARYWFRVAAVGAAGRGGWTEEMSKFAP